MIKVNEKAGIAQMPFKKKKTLLRNNADNLPSMDKEYDTQIKEAYRTPNGWDQIKYTQWHIITKIQKFSTRTQ